ncbi:MAG: hypothetical protein WCV91_04840 [Candidatus Margulisiibacteriota bacterium]
MLTSYLINALIFCGILLLLALTVAVIQIVLMLLDIRRTYNEIKRKLEPIISLLDFVTLIAGGLGGLKGRMASNMMPQKSTMIAFFAGLKKGIEVLFKNKEEKK